MRIVQADLVQERRRALTHDLIEDVRESCALLLDEGRFEGLADVGAHAVDALTTASMDDADTGAPAAVGRLRILIQAAAATVSGGTLRERRALAAAVGAEDTPLHQPSPAAEGRFLQRAGVRMEASLSVKVRHARLL